MIENKTSLTKPDVVTVVYNRFRQEIHIIAFDITHNEETGEWSWKEEAIPAGKFDYAGIVDILIQDIYPIPNMQAVQNNYLLDPDDPVSKEAFNEMQAWRKRSKEIAKEVLAQ